MGILSWIMVGLIAGFLAGVVVKGRDSGFIGYVIIGVVGGVLGGFIASTYFNIGDPMSGINLESILIAFLGAVLLLFLLRLLGDRRSRSRR